MSDWKPKPYRRRAPNRIWHSRENAKWFVNYYDDDIHDSFKTWQEAFDFLCDELEQASPMEVS